MKALLTSLLFLTFSITYAQEFEVPEDYSFDDKEDYEAYEEDIVAAAKWLEATPFNVEKEKRAEVSTFVVGWVNGSPTVTVEIYQVIMDFDKKNPGMLVLFMAAESKYVLENDYSKNVKAKQKAALKSMIKVYKAGKGIEKDKKMDKLVQSDADGKLSEWMEKNLK